MNPVIEQVQKVKHIFEKYLSNRIKYIKVIFLFFFIFCSADFHRVVEVYDGDTFRLSNGERVRLIGIDAPEEGDQYYERAKKELEKMVLKKRVRLEYDVVKRDKYGRLLAYVWIGETFINAELIKKGVANIYTVPPNVKWTEYFLKLQKSAREQKLGLWSLWIKKEKYYIGSKRSLIFHRPDCKFAKRIEPENKIIFKTREEALDAGYAPGRRCNP